MWQQPPNHGGCCLITAEILVGSKQTRPLIEALDHFEQFESSVAHSAAIMAFELAALPSSLTGDVSLHYDNNVVKQIIITVISMATMYVYTCRHDKLVVWLNTRGVETTVAIVHGQLAGRRRKRLP